MTQLQQDINSLLNETDAQSREECERLRDVQRREEATWADLLAWPGESLSVEVQL